MSVTTNFPGHLFVIKDKKDEHLNLNDLMA